MDGRAKQRLTGLLSASRRGLLQGSLIGLEKESLRVSPEGGIAQTPHPVSLGSPLTHPFITTDYSEALAEFITPPRPGINAALGFLREVQSFVYDALDDDELL